MDRATDTPQAAPEPSPPPEAADAAGSPTRGDAPPGPDAVWPRVLDLAGPRLRAMLETMTVEQATPKLLRLGVPAARSAMARDHLADIVRLVQETGARSVSIQIVDLKPAERTEPAAADAPAAQAPAPEGGAAQDAAEADPLVQQAARVFGAKVTHIHPKRR